MIIDLQLQSIHFHSSNAEFANTYYNVKSLRECKAVVNYERPRVLLDTYRYAALPFAHVWCICTTRYCHVLE
jgi:hypothetical protein